MLTPTICPCGKKLATKPEHAGKRVKCPACGQTVLVASRTEAAEDDFALAPAEPRAAPTHVPIEPDQPEAPPAKRAAPERGVSAPPERGACPACAKPTGPGAAVCAHCGHVLKDKDDTEKAASVQTLAQKWATESPKPSWLPTWAQAAWSDDIPHTGFDMATRALIGLGALLALLSLVRPWAPWVAGYQTGATVYWTAACGAAALCGVALVSHRGVYSCLVALSFVAALAGLIGPIMYMVNAPSGWNDITKHQGTWGYLTGSSFDLLLLGPVLALLGLSLTAIASAVYLFANKNAADGD